MINFRSSESCCAKSRDSISFICCSCSRTSVRNDALMSSSFLIVACSKRCYQRHMQHKWMKSKETIPYQGAIACMYIEWERLAQRERAHARAHALGLLAGLHTLSAHLLRFKLCHWARDTVNSNLDSLRCKRRHFFFSEALVMCGVRRLYHV